MEIVAASGGVGMPLLAALAGKELRQTIEVDASPHLALQATAGGYNLSMHITEIKTAPRGQYPGGAVGGCVWGGGGRGGGGAFRWHMWNIGWSWWRGMILLHRG